MTDADPPRRDTAQRILAAADEVLSESGYDGASMRLVAERAGVNKALVFYHFKTKAGLFERVLEGYYREHRAVLDQAFAGGGTLRERLSRTLSDYLDFMAANQRFPRLVQHLLAGPDDQHRQTIQRQLAPLVDWLRDALGEATQGQPHLSPSQFFMTLSGLVTSYFVYGPALAPALGDDPSSPEALAARRAHVLWVLEAVLDRLLGRPGE